MFVKSPGKKGQAPH